MQGLTLRSILQYISEVLSLPDRPGKNKRKPTLPLTLDEAIKHCDDIAGGPDMETAAQLAKWLRELKELRATKRNST